MLNRPRWPPRFGTLTAPEMPPAVGHLKHGATMTSVNDSRAPAGWYHDPLGLPQVRWWNGLSWTNEIEECRPEVQISAAYRVELVGSP